jgi:undecaprenyl-diphosphatase
VTFAEAALLGVVQGLTEFLPVSSSAHLILARAFFGESAGDPAFYLAFDVACHVGTLAAVLLFFRTDIAGLIQAVPFAARGPGDARARRLWLVGIGTVPAVLAGVLFNDAIQAMRTPLVAAIALAVGALLLFAIERLGVQGHGEERLSLGGALAIGVAQAAAMIPGVSRSGATIATGMALGMRRDAAARFTFVMSTPIIVAAAAKEALDLPGLALGRAEIALIVVGVVTSGVVGYAAVKYFVRFLASHRLDVFAWYRLALALVTFTWLAR